jgi:hypothetical protein
MHKEISRDILKKHGSRKKNHRVVKMNKQKEASLNEQNIQQEMLF